MPSVIHEHELDETVCDPDDTDPLPDELFQITSPEGTEETRSADETCDVMLDLVEQQFWDWWANPERSRRFKPRLKVYEVHESC